MLYTRDVFKLQNKMSKMKRGLTLSNDHILIPGLSDLDRMRLKDLNVFSDKLTVLEVNKSFSLHLATMTAQYSEMCL